MTIEQHVADLMPPEMDQEEQEFLDRIDEAADDGADPFADLNLELPEGA